MLTDIVNAIEDEKNLRPIANQLKDDIGFMKTYRLGPYSLMAKRINGLKDFVTRMNDLKKFLFDRQMMQDEQRLQVARCSKIIHPNTAKNDKRFAEVSEELKEASEKMRKVIAFLMLHPDKIVQLGFDHLGTVLARPIAIRTYTYPCVIHGNGSQLFQKHVVNRKNKRYSKSFQRNLNWF